MCSRLINRLRRNTALDLTLRFTLLFLLCASVLFLTVDTLLARAQLEKDQQLIDSFAESYQRLEQQAGLHKLELVIARDEPYFQRSAMRVELLDAHARRQLLVAPQAWGDRPLAEPETGAAAGRWQEATLTGSDIRLLYLRVALSDGSVLSIGQSVAPRLAELERYRLLMLQVMLPLLLFGLLLSGYMNWRLLRPVHDLVATVRSLSAADLNARVLVRNPGSELGELAQLFNQMLSQIERLITGMQHSLDAVGHDLRTPLARMRLSVESALSGADDADLREALLDCAEESERIDTMLRTLMDISEAESGILKLHLQPLELAELAEQSLDLYRYHAEDKGIRLELIAATDSRMVADPVRLRQVLANLLDNAIKYTAEGGCVQLSWSLSADRILIEVADDGIGISAEDQPRVFERLYRADKSRNEPGMGLGLSLVKAVVDAHCGEIRLISQLGKGCRVQVDLPRGSNNPLRSRAPGKSAAVA